MAIAIDTTTKPGARVNAGTTMTVAHTCTGTDGAIVVNVGHQVNITSVTYAGVSMIQVGTTSTDGAGNKTSTFVLAGPSTGTNNVVITVVSSSIIMCEIVSYTGVNQSSPVGANVTNGPTTTTAWTQTVTTTTDNSWLIMCAKGRSGNAVTAGANTTIRVTIEVLFTGLFIADSNSAQTPTGSKSLNVTSTSQEFNGTIFELKPSGAMISTLVVGAGGGGGGWGGGGGGGGKVNYDSAFVVTPQAYSITVGTGGTGGNDTDTIAGDGSDGTASVFSSITSAGGLGGKRLYNAIASPKGNGGNSGNGTNTGGISPRAAPQYPSGGGGGDSGNGVTPAGGSSAGGNGGTGTSNSISGSAITYGGGGGGSVAPSGTIGTGTDGGGDASKTTHGLSGAANRGGGGGGCANAPALVGGTGGNGVVIISYATDGSDGVSTSSTGGTITTSGGQTIHTFTTSGTFTMVASTTYTFIPRIIIF